MNFQNMISKQIHAQIKQDFKNVFQPKLTHKILSTHYFKVSSSGKIHIVHRITGMALCNRVKQKFEFNGFTNITEINENDLCKNCVRFHNGFKVFKDEQH